MIRLTLAGLALVITTEKGLSEDLALLSSDLFKYVRDNGGFIHAGIRMSHTSHEGASVRGLITKDPIANHEMIMRIPFKVWMREDMEIQPELDISSWTGPCGLNQQQAKFLRFGAAVVREQRSGSASFFAPYLKGLPSSQQLRASMPRLAAQAWLRDFRALPLLWRVQGQQDEDRVVQRCFEARKGGNALLADITWAEVEAVIFNFHTRKFKYNDTVSALVPVLENLNTEIGTKINTLWQLSLQGDDFYLIATAPIQENEELYSDYCRFCDNGDMVDRYGIYFERNPIPLDMSEASRVDCNDEALRVATMAALEEPPDPQSDESSFRAPRCTAAALAMEGGPLRCSLSRLAWEYCGILWQGGERPAFDEEKITVSCGNHKAKNCMGCPQGNGASWCKGECIWRDDGCHLRGWQSHREEL